jgi:predicted PurR-regulated permease PerM
MSTPELPTAAAQPVASPPERLFMNPRAPLRIDIAAWVLMGLALAYVLEMHLLPALLGGLLAFELVHGLAPRITGRRLSGSRARMVVVALLATAVVGLLGLAVLGLIAYARSGGGNVSGLFHKMAEIIEAYRTAAPAWVLEYLPENAEEIRRSTVAWLRAHASDLQIIGTEAGRTVAHILIGMIIGAMVALQEAAPSGALRPLAESLRTRVGLLASSFRRVVFAQVRIAALNTFFTWLYLGVALPLFGIELPFLKTLIVVTFVCGLLPVLGNLISNTVIVVVSLNHSLGVAVASLSYLVLIHKLEYFLNARIIGSQIRTKAWEILLAMLAMEVAFGIPGVIAAPIFYAYLKDELTHRELI